MALLAGIAGPVDIRRKATCRQALTHGLGEAGQLLGALLLVPQQHEKGPKLGILGLAIEQHPHSLTGFRAGQVASAALAFAKDADKYGKGMFGRSFKDHMQFVGLGSPASLAASLAGVPLNS